MVIALIILILIIPLVAFISGFFVLQSVQLGLKWQLQVENKEEPILEIVNPIKKEPTISVDDRQPYVFENLADEWINGPKER